MAKKIENLMTVEGRILNKYGNKVSVEVVVEKGVATRISIDFDSVSTEGFFSADNYADISTYKSKFKYDGTEMVMALYGMNIYTAEDAQREILQQIQPRIEKAIEYSMSVNGNSIIAKYIYPDEDKVSIFSLDGAFLGCVFNYNDKDSAFTMSQLYRDMYVGDCDEVKLIIDNDRNGERTKGNDVNVVPSKGYFTCINDHKLCKFSFGYNKVILDYEA